MAIKRFSAIRHLAASYAGDRFAAGEFESTVSVWEMGTRLKISEFETPLDPGGQRLAINRAGNECAVASYNLGGVALYDANSGELKGGRDKLGKLQYVTYSADDTRLYCCGDHNSCTVLDSANFKVIANYKQIYKVFCSSIGNHEHAFAGFLGTKGSVIFGVRKTASWPLLKEARPQSSTQPLVMIVFA